MSENVDIQPRFQAERVTGTFYRTIINIEEVVREVPDGKGGVRKMITRSLKPTRVEYNDAYEIYFPQGHSIRVPADDEATLRRIGVLEEPGFVDMNSGETVPVGHALTPKQIVARKTRSRHTGGLSELEAME